MYLTKHKINDLFTSLSKGKSFDKLDFSQRGGYHNGLSLYQYNHLPLMYKYVHIHSKQLAGTQT